MFAIRSGVGVIGQTDFEGKRTKGGEGWERESVSMRAPNCPAFQTKLGSNLLL